MLIPWHFYSAVLGCKAGTRKLSGKEIQVANNGKAGQGSQKRCGEGNMRRVPTVQLPIQTWSSSEIPDRLVSPTPEKNVSNPAPLSFTPTPRTLRILYPERHILSFLVVPTASALVSNWLSDTQPLPPLIYPPKKKKKPA